MGLLSTPTIPDSEFTYSTDGESDRFNIWEMVAIVSGGTMLVNGIAVLGALAPSFTAVFGTTAVATAYIGYCKRHNLDFNPTTWDMFQKSDEGKKVVADVQPVTDTKGNEVPVEGL